MIQLFSRHDLDAIRNALLEDGWNDTFFQMHFEGQYFGLVKTVAPDVEFHARGYIDGKLDAHVEIDRKYLEHHSAPSEDATGHLIPVLNRAGISYRIEGSIETPQSYNVPPHLTSWGSVIGIGLAVFGIALLLRPSR